MACNNIIPIDISFKSLIRSVETLEPNLTTALDNSFWSSISVSNRTDLVDALKALGLIDEDRKVQPILERLIDAQGKNKKAILFEVIDKAYPGVIRVLGKNPTYRQFQDYFVASGVQVNILESTTKFFLDALSYLDLRVSPFCSLGLNSSG